jgi:hypothetical protein
MSPSVYPVIIPSLSHCSSSMLLPLPLPVLAGIFLGRHTLLHSPEILHQLLPKLAMALWGDSRKAIGQKNLDLGTIRTRNYSIKLMCFSLDQPAWSLDRILSKCRRDICRANQSDNTGKAVNVAAALKLDGLRCVAHLLALGPRHLLHPVRRTTAGLHRMVAHERAQKEAFELCEKIRRFVKHVNNREQKVSRAVVICGPGPQAERSCQLGQPFGGTLVC